MHQQGKSCFCAKLYQNTRLQTPTHKSEGSLVGFSNWYANVHFVGEVFLSIHFSPHLNIILFIRPSHLFFSLDPWRSKGSSRAAPAPHTQSPQDKRPHSKCKGVFACTYRFVYMRAFWVIYLCMVCVCVCLQAQSLASSLSTRQLLRICRRLSQYPEESIAHAVNKACLSRYTQIH